MARLFGTDGVRGTANRQLTPELAFQLGRAAAVILAAGEARPQILVGKDPRASGDMLEAALSAGMMSGGADVLSVGVVPTPAVAYLTKHLPVKAGAMISASHNPVEDNGIKFFSHEGYKLPDRTEDEIEAYLRSDHNPTDRPLGVAVGSMRRDSAQVGSYLQALHASLAGQRLDGMKLVLDCANGSAAPYAADLFRSVGAEPIMLHDQPDGGNINRQCGSTHPESLQRAVQEQKADCGFAFDGDADRCLAVDAAGNLVDGDQIMAMLAADLKQRGKLAQNTLVITVMSNLGLKKAMAEQQIALEVTAVGDRYVLEAMRQKGFCLGGEQSGHLILSEYATTGDGMLTALQTAALLRRTGKSMQEAAAIMRRFPQVLLNFRVKDKHEAMNDAAFRAAIAREEEKMGARGRVLVRASGTEALVRIMVEAETQEEAAEAATRLGEFLPKE